MLQLNNIELSEYIEEELEKNPLLERVEDPQESALSDGAEQENAAAENRDEMDAAFESPEAYDFDPGSSMATVGAGGNTKFETADDMFENNMSAEKTLREHLMEQMLLSFADERDRMIGTLLIDMLDERGYLREGFEELEARLGCAPERLSGLLVRMKQFDPTGVFAKDLTECLILQLEEQGKYDAPMQKLLANLQLLADHDLRRLMDVCGVNETYLHDMIAEIRSLNPNPASAFEHLVVQTAIPDVLMKRLPKNLGGGWRVELNAETLPRVLINQDYYANVSNGSKQKKDKEYLNSQMASANWLVRALDQRAQTILKVASEVVERQDAFFNYGIEFLCPLTLRDVAEAIEMHESTVSRVTTNKYIGTPRGIFELKFFFTTGITSSDGSVHSAEAIKARIRSMIEAEKPDEILSDDTIVDELKKEGIDIARRTVAKYREGMNIGSSVQRRRQKRNRL